jgi:DNA oxidative demethylase
VKTGSRLARVEEQGMQLMKTTSSTPRGLVLAYEAMTRAEEDDLIAEMQASGLSRSHFGDEPGNPRSSMSYLYRYDLPSQSFVRAPPVPEGFHAIARRAAAFAGLESEEIMHCALNLYEPGAMIQSHIDMPCWDRVVGISLGAAAIMNLRRVTADGDETIAIELPPRSMYLLRDEARHDWEHAIPRVAHRRWSITFRSFSDAGMREGYSTDLSRRYA